MSRGHVLVVCRECRGRVLLLSPSGGDVHDLLWRARIPSAARLHGRTVRAKRLPDALAMAQARRWHVVESRARREAR